MKVFGMELGGGGNGQTASPAANLTLSEQARALLSPLNLHWAGVGLLGLINLYLLIHIGFLWQTAHSQDDEALAQQGVALKTAEIAARPLEGLDGKLKSASTNADKFYLERLPVSYSEVATELGAVAASDHVRLTRVQYAQSAVDGDAAGQLTQVQMDASLSGDYRSLVQFINGLERDRVFFVITGMALTGQQTGQVNLRLRVTTYIRGAGSAEEMAKVQILPAPAPETVMAVSGGAR
jgi:type IV pilus assembly protein PilO